MYLYVRPKIQTVNDISFFVICYSKDRLISKGLFVLILPKNERNISAPVDWAKINIFKFGFWVLGELKTLKFPFEI